MTDHKQRFRLKAQDDEPILTPMPEVKIDDDDVALARRVITLLNETPMMHKTVVVPRDVVLDLISIVRSTKLLTEGFSQAQDVAAAAERAQYESEKSGMLFIAAIVHKLGNGLVELSEHELREAEMLTLERGEIPEVDGFGGGISIRAYTTPEAFELARLSKGGNIILGGH